MTRIIVGVDGSEHSERALEWAVEEARRTSSSLVVVHAWAVPATAYGTSLMPYTPPFADRLRLGELASTAVDDMLARTDLGGVDADVHVVQGHAGEALVHVARQGDVIVVGTRGRSALAELVAGSTARYVTRHAAVPVVVVPQHRAVEREEAVA